MQRFFGLPDKRYQRRNGITSKIGREDAADKIDNAADSPGYHCGIHRQFDFFGDLS